MPDREKVIKGLEELHGSQETMKLISDAIAMLKEQAPLEPELEGGGSNWWYVCGECHGAIDERDAFCKHCGRAVKKKK